MKCDKEKREEEKLNTGGGQETECMQVTGVVAKGYIKLIFWF